jgi:heme/copper-type cytochrome/quinol oxidase subunit 2
MIVWCSFTIAVCILGFSVYIWYELTQNPLSASGMVFVGINNILFPTFVVSAVLFHTLTYTLLLFRIYFAMKGKKNKAIESKMIVAWKRLWLFFIFVIAAIPSFIYAERTTYEDPMKVFFHAFSLNLLGLNVIAMIYLFQAIGLLVKSDKPIQNLKLPSHRPTLSDTKPAATVPIETTQLV